MGTEPTIRVFVSSTQQDQPDRHQQVREIVDAFPLLEAVSQQRFTAEIVDAKTGDEEKIRSSWLVLFLLGHRYGSCPPGSEKSFVELEFDTACKYDIDRLVFFLDEEVVPPSPKKGERNVDDGEDWQKAYDKQKTLKKRAVTGQTQATPFTDVTLPGLVVQALLEWARRRDIKLVPTRVATKSPSYGNDPRAVADYRDRVRREYEHVQLVGLPKNVRMPIRLEDLWAPLRGTGKSGGTPLMLAFADGKTRSIVLLGNPGSGKTTWLRRLGLACLSSEPPQGFPTDVLPVYLPLRQFREEDLTLGPEQLLARNLRAASTDEREFCRWLMRDRGNLLLLFDGLDEVPRPMRPRVARWIAQLAEPPTVRVAVTSRTTGYAEDARLPSPFSQLEVSPLSDPVADEFIARWFALVEPEHATERAGALQRYLEDATRKHIRLNELRSNPLTLTILCLVFRDRGAALSTERADLYQDCMQVLLDRWRIAGLMVQWSPRDAIRILQPVALEMHLRHVARLSRSELEPVVAASLRSQGSLAPAADFLRDLGEESGLLADHGNDEFGFLHLCFQEYLAARELRRLVVATTLHGKDGKLLGEAASRMQEDRDRSPDKRRWAEVTDLLMAMDAESEGHLATEPVEERLRMLADYHRISPAAIGPDLLKQFLKSLRHTTPFDEDLLRAVARRDPGPFVTFLQNEAKSAKSAAELGGRVEAAFAAVRVLAPTTADELARQMPWLIRTESSPVPPTAKLARREYRGMRFVQIPAGSFLMGSPNKERGRWDIEGPQVLVTIRQTFWLATSAVTNAQYRAFVEANRYQRPESWKRSSLNADDQPVVTVSWEDAVAFCKWTGLRLPTEAEWEYACRAGSESPFSCGNNITTEQVNYHGYYPYVDGKKGEYLGRTVPVGSLPANAWGLHEMHGNVWEWCQDSWHDSYEGAPDDGSSWEQGGSGDRVVRGGSWVDAAWRCRSAYRSRGHPGGRTDSLGFRPASSSPPL